MTHARILSMARFMLFALLLWRSLIAAAPADAAEPAKLLAGPVVVSNGAASGDFATLQQAFQAINNGVYTGALVVSIRGDTIETASALLNASGSGAASYTSLLLRPEGGARKISGTFAGPLVDFNGADNVVFDGRPDGAGENRALTLVNNSPSGGALRFRNDATGNTIRYVKLLASDTTDCTSSKVGGVIAFGGTTGVTGNDSNTIDHCAIGDAEGGTPRLGICAFGSSGKMNNDISVTNNDIYNFWRPDTHSEGVLMPSSSNNAGWTISGNSFYQTTARVPGGTLSQWAINIISTGSFVIEDNYIGGSEPGAGGAPWTINSNEAAQFVPIRLTAGKSEVTSLQGNTIRNIDLKTGSTWYTIPGVFCGMYLVEGWLDVGGTRGNVIGDDNVRDSIRIATGDGAFSYGMCITATGPRQLRNNIVGGITVRTDVFRAASSFIGIDFSGTSTANAIVVADNLVGSRTVPDSIITIAADSDDKGQKLWGIHSKSASAISVTGNTIANLTNAYTGSLIDGQTHGISIQTGKPQVDITDNIVRDLRSAGASASVAGQAVLGGIMADLSTTTSAVNVTGNAVYALSNTAATAAVTVVGIHHRSGAEEGNIVSRNLVHSLSAQTSAPEARVIGLQAGGGVVTYSANMVALGKTFDGAPLSTRAALFGIYHPNVAGAVQRTYFNTVYLAGAGESASAALVRASTGSDAYLNNLLFNGRTAAAGGAYALWLETTEGLSPAACDNNLLYTPGVGGQVGRVGATDYITLGAWREGAGYDLNSVAGDPRLIRPEGAGETLDLHVDPTSEILSPAESAGMPVDGVADEYDGETRNATTPDIGADEFAQAEASHLLGVYRNVTAPVNGLQLAGETTIEGALTLDGTLDLTSHTLLLGDTATVAGRPFSAARMVVADGGGQLCRNYNAPGEFTFPIGDASGESDYAPVTLTVINARFDTAHLCVRVADTAHPVGDPGHYGASLSRYWTVTQSGLADFTCDVALQYVDQDVTLAPNYDEDDLYLWKFDGEWQTLDRGDASQNVLRGRVTSFSDFTGRSATPTAVVIARLAAEPTARHVRIVWQAVTEQDTAGYRIYRSSSASGPWQTPFSELIPAESPGSSESRTYAWLDTAAEPGQTYFYVLEEVEWGGATHRFGPVQATLTAPNTVALRSFTARSVQLWSVDRFIGWQR